MPDEGGAEARPGPSASHEPSGAASRQEACEQQAEPSGRGIATGKREDAAPPACCEVCSSLTFDGQYWSAFGVAVCSSCKRDYKLISKVAAKQIYLVTDGDLKKLGSVEKDNPRRNNWGKMRLYLMRQVEEVAMRRHGSLSALEQARVAQVQSRIKRRLEKREREEWEEERQQEEAETVRRVLEERERERRRTYERSAGPTTAEVEDL